MVEPEKVFSVGELEPESEIESESSESVVEEYEETETVEESSGRFRPIEEPASEESSTYANYNEYNPPMRSCKLCDKSVGCLRDCLIAMEPVWKWVFVQTRWPVRFSPQQKVDLSMNGVHVPPWRVSSALMLNDCCRYCSVKRDVRNLALLDPMVSGI